MHWSQRSRRLIVAFVPVLMAGCDAGDRRANAAMETMTAEDLMRHIRVLAADSLEGRGPSSPGEAKTIAYLRAEFEALGLRPGNGQRWFQEVPLVAMTTDKNTTLTVRGRGAPSTYRYAMDFVAFTKRVVPTSEIRNSELVFAGSAWSRRSTGGTTTPASTRAARPSWSW